MKMTSSNKRSGSPIGKVAALVFGLLALAMFCLRMLPEQITAPAVNWLLRSESLESGAQLQLTTLARTLLLGVELITLVLAVLATGGLCRSYANKQPGQPAHAAHSAIGLAAGWLVMLVVQTWLVYRVMNVRLPEDAIGGLALESLLVSLATVGLFFGWRRPVPQRN